MREMGRSRFNYRKMEFREGGNGTWNTGMRRGRNRNRVRQNGVRVKGSRGRKSRYHDNIRLINETHVGQCKRGIHLTPVNHCQKCTPNTVETNSHPLVPILI